VEDDRRSRLPLDRVPDDAASPRPDIAEADGPERAPPDAVDLSALSVAGITRRRVGWATAILVSVWIVLVFARQAGEAATASARSDQIAADNAALAAEVAALGHELDVIKQPEYIALQARAYGLGKGNEIPFVLDPSVPTPGPNAPGSAALRVGAEDQRMSPLDSWLSILFGPAD
jgi:cell division protein FtsB